MVALVERNFPEAMKWFRVAVENDSTRDEAWIGLCRAAHEQWLGNKTLAGEFLSVVAEGLQNNLGLEDFYLLRARLLSYQARQFFDQQGRIEESEQRWLEAEADATRAIEQLWPDGGWEYTLRSRIRSAWGIALWERGSPRAGELLQQAVADAGEALAHEQRTAESYDVRGKALERLGDWKASRGEDPTKEYGGAIQDFTEAVATDPQFAEGYHNRGTALHS